LPNDPEVTAIARANAPLAPRWHTLALVGLILGVSLSGTLLARYGARVPAVRAPQGTASARIFSQYLPLLLVNWGLVVYCVRLFRKRGALSELLGERWSSAWRAFSDLAAASACFCLIMLSEFACARLFSVGRNAAIASLLPSTEAERLTWLVVALSVGFCEEVVYRGYLQTQLAALTRSPSLGLLLQAMLFGIAHLDQGLPLALRIAEYGLLFGVLARVRRSLWPGILCHVAVDLAAVFLR
jgi:membrane protease YdiL (CAAX protease family)